MVNSNMFRQSNDLSRPPFGPRNLAICRTSPRRRCVFLLAGIVFVLRLCSAQAQIQQAWVARYNNGITNGTNQAVKMALDPAGNIYVTGYSENANTNLGYVTIKYAPNGNQLWASRYDSTDSPTAIPSAMVLDNSNNVIVTGNALTIKYDANGNQLWTAPYQGTSLAVDGSGNCVVTGVYTGFVTVKLNPNGSNLWLNYVADTYGPNVSQVVLVDSNSNVYVAGAETYTCLEDLCYEQLLILKYDHNGNQVWTTTFNPGGSVYSVDVGGAALDAANNCSLIVNSNDESVPTALQYNSDGSLNWTSYLNQGGINPAFTLAVDNRSDIVVAGESAYAFTGVLEYYYTIIALSTNGNPMWANHYPQLPFGVRRNHLCCD
jgi:hypothetical protein